MKQFSQQTLVPVGLVIVLGSTIFTLGQSYSKIEEHEAKLGIYYSRQLEAENKLDSIMQTLARIEERLANIKK